MSRKQEIKKGEKEKRTRQTIWEELDKRKGQETPKGGLEGQMRSSKNVKIQCVKIRK